MQLPLKCFHKSLEFFVCFWCGSMKLAKHIKKGSADLPRVMNDCPGVVFVPFDTVEFAWNITLISAADRQLTPFEQSVQKDIAALFR